MADNWDGMTTDQKLAALLKAAKDQSEGLQQQAAYTNGLSLRLQDLEKRVTAQVLPMVEQIGDLTARVEALEGAPAAKRRD
ncbi:MAG: hypothetical protein JWP49_2007 [Phenylobacterium sp.]|nr:hypothetical protein [Phenylobacterium sp.]